MRDPVRKRWIEDHVHPVLREKAPIDDLVAGRRVHPAVGGQDPERREQRAAAHHDGGEQMDPLRNQLASEQQDAKEAGLEEERDQAFVGQQRRQHVAGRIRESAPVGAQLKRHHDSRHDAHSE
jgi:hypothetical protein